MRILKISTIFKKKCLFLLLMVIMIASMLAVNVLPLSASPGSSYPGMVAVNSVTNKIYVTNPDSNSITVMDGATNSTSTIPLENTPFDLAVNSVTNKIYVSNPSSNNVMVIDGATNTTEAAISVGNSPSFVAVNPVTNKIYVSNPNSNSVMVIDGATNTTGAAISVENLPGSVAVNPVTNKIYVSSLASNNITVIDGATNTTSTIPVGVSYSFLAVNSVTNKIYVTSPGYNDLTMIDGATNTISAMSSNSPGSVAVNSVTNKIYVVNTLNNNIIGIDGANNTISTTTLPVGPNFYYLAANLVTNKIYVSNPISNSVTVIDGATNTTEAAITVGNSPEDVAVDSVTNKIYVVNEESNSVSVIDGATNTTGTAIFVGDHPRAVAVNPVTNKIYVANYGSGSVTVIDGATNITSTIFVGYGPSAVAVNSVTNKIYVVNQVSNSLTAIDGATNNAISTIYLGLVPEGVDPSAVVVNSVTNKIYFANMNNNSVTVIDGATNNIITTITLENKPLAMAVNSVTNKIYITNFFAGNSVTVIDGVTNSTSTIPVRDPYDVAVNSVTNKIYVTSVAYGVRVINEPTPTGAILGTVTDGTNPVAAANVSLTVNGTVYSATTGADGTYCIQNVPIGTGYTITATKTGYNNGGATANVTENTTTLGVNVITVPITVPVIVSNEPITVSADQPNFAITSAILTSAGNNPVTINVPSGVNNANLDVASLLQTPSSGMVTSSGLPALTISAAVDLNNNGSTPVNVQVQIPLGTTVSAPEGWDGTIHMPTVQSTNSVTVTPTNGFTDTVNSVIEVGYGDVPLTFNHAVRFLIPGQAGKKAGYVRGGKFYPITTTLSADNQTISDNTLAAGQDGYINVGSDLVIWTKHFTKFVTYSETSISTPVVSTPSGGFVGGGAPAPAPAPTSTSTPTVNGVQRLFGQNQVDTSLAIAKANYPGKVANVVLATADNYPDALAGSVLAYQLKSPILLVGSTDTDQVKILAYIKSNLDAKGTVYILGGTAVVSADMEAKVTASGFSHIIRLGGIDRYATSVQIAEQLKVKIGTPIVLAYGENYPDALSISSIAAKMQYPILLVQKDGLSDVVKNEIAAIKPSKVYIIGGEGVISANVESQAAKIASIDKANIVRIAGTDRYETSLAIAKYFNLTENVCIATGNNFPDALAGSVYAANHNAPIVLADGNLSDQVINYLKSKKLTGATIFGGEAVISKDIEQQLEQLIGQ